MKTAEEWQDVLYSSWHGQSEIITVDEIRQIQLDAMKEGARRAARINRANMDKWRLTKEKDIGWGAEVSALDILTTAEQWTTKDL